MEDTMTQGVREGCFRGLMAVIAGVAIICVLALLFTGCKSVQVKENINYRDSVISHHKYDTTRITFTDTLHVTASSESERESDTDIVFGSGGGTYNTQTGEATNVVGVKQSKKEKELQQLVVVQKTTIDKQSAIIDEQKEQITKLEKELEEKQNTADIVPQRKSWDRFCAWYTIISWVLVLLIVAWKLFKRFYLKR